MCMCGCAVEVVERSAENPIHSNTAYDGPSVFVFCIIICFDQWSILTRPQPAACH